jgi:hypothetical protein
MLTFWIVVVVVAMCSGFFIGESIRLGNVLAGANPGSGQSRLMSVCFAVAVGGGLLQFPFLAVLFLPCPVYVLFGGADKDVRKAFDKLPREQQTDANLHRFRQLTRFGALACTATGIAGLAYIFLK